MFQHFKNIDTAFKHVRLFSFLLLLAKVVSVCFCIYKSYALVDAAQNRVHILYNGKVLEALAADWKENIPVELRDHIKVFHEDFFSLFPDDKEITATVTKAFYLADESAKRAYDNLREAGYYNNLVSGNISQQVAVDSFWLGLVLFLFSFFFFVSVFLLCSF